MADILVRQAHECKGTADYAERYDLALRFCERMEPRSRGVLGEIEATGGSLVGRVFGRAIAKKDDVEAA